MKKMWGGRFTQPTNKLVEAYTASIGFDQRLAEVDIEGSMAHVRMLGRVGVLTPDEADAIVQGLRKVKQRIDSGEVSYSVAYEDIHMNIEKMLTDEIGPLGGKLHTGRSRNDQVALDLHLYVKRVTVQTVEQLARLQEALLQKAEEHVDTILPGTPTCSGRSQFASPTTCSPMWPCSAGTSNGCKTVTSALTAVPSERVLSPGPHFPLTGKSSQKNSGFPPCTTTAWMLSATAILSSSF